METNNGLRLSMIKSSVVINNKIDLSDSNTLKSYVRTNFVQKGICIFYFDYGVQIGKYDSEDFRLFKQEIPEPRFIWKMRLFNQNQELFIWKKNANGFAGRLRIDGEGDETDVVDAKQMLWGTDSQPQDDFSELFEDRGTKIILPFKDLKVNKENRIFILTRNYVSYKTCDSSYEQAGYVDSRFVAFTDKNGTPLGV